MSAGTTGLGWCLTAGALAVASLGPAELAGFARIDVALALLFAAFALSLTGWVAGQARVGRDAALSALAVWAVAVALLVTTFAHRDVLLAGFGDLRDELGGATEVVSVQAGGEVAVTRRRDGHFTVPASVNGQDVRFVFDTGATTVVLSTDTARRLGLAPETLRFRVPVATANGRALAAPVTLDRLAVGPIVVRNVRALVAQPGLLDGDLLGQTFLDRLDSYEVRGNRLVLRARPT